MSQENEQLNNPLHGLKLDTLLNELVSYYGFGILAEYTRINCFKSNPSIASSLKFLRKTEWAREKLERFYLYEFKSLPPASEEEFDIPPRQRIIPQHIKPKEPKVLVRGEAIVPLSKDSFKETHRAKPEHKKAYKKEHKREHRRASNSASDNSASSNENKPFDPYADAPR
ncbi:MAG: VF530 family DNA-binding protein [Cognaticolwellia sp.]